MVEAANPLWLESADRIGNTLCRDAVWDGRRCTWMGWAMSMANQKKTPAYRAFSNDFYGGTSGIALFLAELFHFTGDREQLRAMEGAINQGISVSDVIDSRFKHSFYSGLCGLAYSYARIGSLLGREKLIDFGLSLLDRLRALPIDVNHIDVITGSAGAIPAFLFLAKSYQRSEFIDLAFTHGKHLLKSAELNEFGCSWPTLRHTAHPNLTGHAHGVAGIVTALLELHHVTGEQEFFDVAMEGFRYEQHWFDLGHANWPDLRKAESMHPEAVNVSFNTAWCQGAPGIGLSRLRNAEILKDNADVLKDLEAAIQTTAKSLTPPWVPGNGNYSLCHGAAGNAELMIMAGQKLNRPELTRIAEKVGEEGIEFYVKQGLPWPCGNGGAGETPNLMLGTAGIGHFYLRLYDPVAVPSVLIITPDV